MCCVFRSHFHKCSFLWSFCWLSGRNSVQIDLVKYHVLICAVFTDQIVLGYITVELVNLREKWYIQILNIFIVQSYCLLSTCTIHQWGLDQIYYDRDPDSFIIWEYITSEGSVPHLINHLTSSVVNLMMNFFIAKESLSNYLIMSKKTEWRILVY